jgi:hypothetical protein
MSMVSPRATEGNQRKPALGTLRFNYMEYNIMLTGRPENNPVADPDIRDWIRIQVFTNDPRLTFLL